jgi:hypothetical protein
MFTVTNLYNTQVTDIGPKLYEITYNYNQIKIYVEFLFVGIIVVYVNHGHVNKLFQIQKHPLRKESHACMHACT